MNNIGSWLRTNIAAHSLADDREPERVKRLVSACLSLKRGYGDLFGMAWPSAGIEHLREHYNESCLALLRWVVVLREGNLKDQLMLVIQRQQLEVMVSDAQRRAYSKGEVPLECGTERPDAIGDVARVVARLAQNKDTNGVEYHVSPMLTDDELGEMLDLNRSLVPLEALLPSLPSHLELKWRNAHSGLRGECFYSVASIDSLATARRTAVNGVPNADPEYDKVWFESAPFMKTSDGNGYIASRDDGSIVYLDDSGNTDVHGTIISASLEEFWNTWVALCFVAIDTMTVRLVRSEGFRASSSLGKRVREAIGEI